MATFAIMPVNEAALWPFTIRVCDTIRTMFAGKVRYHARSRRSNGLIRSQPHQPVTDGFERPPAGCHARRNLQQVGRDTLVHALQAFLLYDRPYGAPDGVVLVTHSGHGVDLESSPQNIAEIGISSGSSKRKVSRHTMDMCKSAQFLLQ